MIFIPKKFILSNNITKEDQEYYLNIIVGDNK